VGWASIHKKIVDVALNRWWRYHREILIGRSLPEEDSIILCCMQVFGDVVEAMVV
jgi:hypothetical protein